MTFGHGRRLTARATTSACSDLPRRSGAPPARRARGPISASCAMRTASRSASAAIRRTCAPPATRASRASAARIRSTSTTASRRPSVRSRRRWRDERAGAPGKVRHLGLSRSQPQRCGAPPRCIRSRRCRASYSLWTREPEQDGRHPRGCRELGAAFVATAPLGRGFPPARSTTWTALGQDDFRRISRARAGEFRPQPGPGRAGRALASEKGCTRELALAGSLRAGRTWSRSRAPSGVSIWRRTRRPRGEARGARSRAHRRAAARAPPPGSANGQLGMSLTNR